MYRLRAIYLGQLHICTLKSHLTHQHRVLPDASDCVHEHFSEQVTYDKDGNHIVDWDELEELRKANNPWVVQKRL